MKIIRRVDYILLPVKPLRGSSGARPRRASLAALLAGPELRWALIGAITATATFAAMTWWTLHP